MTYCTDELRERGVYECVLAWRRWRRAMRLPQDEAAAMAQLHPRTVRDAELGLHKPHERTLEKLDALRERWERAGWPRRDETRGRKKRRR